MRVQQTVPGTSAGRRRGPALHGPGQSLVLALALAATVAPAPAGATPGDCTQSGENHGNTDSQKQYKINTQSFSTYIRYFTQSDSKQAVILAADTWNEQANAGFFKYVGTTTYNDHLPEYQDNGTADDCESKGINFSLVWVRPQADCPGPPGGHYSYTHGRCRDAQGKATQFELEFCSDYDYISGNQDFFIGDVVSARRDMIRNLAHELGHTLNMYHPGENEEATMDYTAVGQNSHRDLYQWDLVCAQEEGGDRSLEAYYRVQGSNGSFGSESLLANDDIAKASAGAYYDSSGDFVNFSATVKSDDSWYWLEDLWYPHSQSISTLVGTGPREAVWRENPLVQRIFYSDYLEYNSNGSPDPYDADAKHWVRYRRFNSDDPSTGQGYGNMKFCTSMTSWLYCTNSTTYRKPLFSGKPVAVAWNEYIDRSVFAWANQTRTNNAAEREILVSVGYVTGTHYVLPTPDRVTKGIGVYVRTRVAPAVACKPSSGYNCIVAYVDEQDATGKVLVKRFYSYQSGYRYLSYFEPFTSYEVGGYMSASSLAAWYNSSTGRFYVALRRADTNQRLYVLSSTDGTSWSLHTVGDPIATGPTAVSYRDGSTNMIVYTKP